MLEGIPLDMVEDDVGHHLPIFASLKHPCECSPGLSVARDKRWILAKA